jgi:hypothetical protein
LGLRVPAVQAKIREREVSRAILLALVVGLGACGSEPARVSVVKQHEPGLRSLEYHFVTHGRGGSSSHALALASVAHGRLTVVPLDEPPVIVGSIAVDRLQLRSAGQIVASLQPGEWPFLARRTSNGTIDALWLAADMPSEAQSLTRFLAAELSTPASDIEVREEETPVGSLQARYYAIEGMARSVGLRVRHASADVPTRAIAVALFTADEQGIVMIGAGQFIRTSLDQQNELASTSLVFVRRRSTTVLPDSEAPQLRARIEALSVSPPIPLIELPRSEREKDAMRRDAETWESVRARLLLASKAEPTLVSRAAAHLGADDNLVDDLRRLAVEPGTPPAAIAAIYLVLGECGTPACQDALLDALLLDDGVRPEVLAGLTRVSAPLAETVDRLLALDQPDLEVARSTIGVVLSRFAEVDPAAAADRVERVVGGLAGCPVELEELFAMLGNAGLPASKPVLLACLDVGVVEDRRTAAAGAMRRIPGADVTGTLVRLVVEDPSTKVRLAGLRALVFRDLHDHELAPLASVGVNRWGVTELGVLLDVLERVAEPGAVVAGLLAEIEGAEDEELAARARILSAGVGE